MPKLCVDDVREAARGTLPPVLWDFIEGGGGAELTLAANERAFTTVGIRPRVLVDVAKVDTATTLFGAGLAAPLGVAPMAYHRLVHDGGEVDTARGAGAAGALMVVSIFASRTLEEIAAAATGPLWLQLYWLRQRTVVEELAGRAAAAGFRALVLTVDAPRIGRRLRDLRNGFAVDPEIRAVNLDPALMAPAHVSQVGSSGIAAHAAATFDPTITWSDLAWLRERTGLPLVLKGVLTAEDAHRAVDCGVSALVVSNHGGRQLDTGTASLDALAEVVDAVDGRCPVLFDGGVRAGRDVFIALARGAATVLIGRPVLWALATGGATGVADLLALLREELTETMALAGRPALSGIDRSAITPSAITPSAITWEARR